jgi:hypothetical protein
MGSEPSFAIPARPQREYPYSGGVEYEGQTIFSLRPSDERSNDALSELLRQTLADGPYRYGDFYNLPMTLYLVRDEQTDDVFRASVRDGRIRLHVLPETESPGLRGLYDRLSDRTPYTFRVECDTSA